MHTTHAIDRRPPRGLQLALAGLLVSVLPSVTACDFLEKKANEQLEKELKSDAEKKLPHDDERGAPKSSGAAAADEKDAPSADGPLWTDAAGATTRMTRVKIDAGGLTGLSMLAPEGAEAKASLGGRGADVANFGVGFAVWVTEDPTATLALMKGAFSAVYGSEAKIESEDKNSIIIAGKMGEESFYVYQGLFEANGKIYRCETERTQAGPTKAHAEAIDKACESLELDGKPIGSSAPEPAEEKVADAREAQPSEPESVDASGGKKHAAPAAPPPPAPPKTPAPQGTPKPPAPQPTQASVTPPKSTSKSTGVKPVLRRTKP